MTFVINMQELRERAAKRVATVATVATLRPDGVSKVAALAAVAEDFAAPALHIDARTCAGCSNRQPHGTCGEPVAAGLAPKFEIRWPPAGHAQTCPGYIAKAPSPAQDRPYRLSKAAASRCHLGGWNDAESETFTTRMLHFIRRSITAGDADDLAELFVLRDRDGDDRRSCAECVHGRGAHCPDGAPLPVEMLHRCSNFEAP